MAGDDKSLAPTLIAAGVGIVVGALAYAILQPTVSGDEAPIRVKNGSLRMELLHKTQKFKDKPQSQKKEWNIDGGNKGSANFEVYFAASQDQGGCAVRKAAGPTVVITMSDGNTVTLSVSGNKTQIVAANALNNTNDDRLLEYGAATAYVSSIAVGGQTCALNAKDNGLSVVMIDE